MSQTGGDRLATVAAALAILLVSMAAPPAGAQLGAPALPQTQAFDPDTVLLDASLATDGDASWEIRYLIRLDDENATAAFESLDADVQANRTAYSDRFADRIGGTVGAAENATGREMAVRNVTVRTTRQDLTRQYGVLVYGFEWTNFAVANDSALRAGDAIAGLFLDETTSLMVSWPDGYRVVSSDPAPDETGDQSATWRGPADFTTSQPRLVVSSAPPPPTDTGEGDTMPTSIVAGALVLLLVGAGLGWWWRRRESTDDPVTADDDAPPEELLSNEERVLRLLREHGGRMKQQQVVEELGWTDAKTSQVVGELREAGELEGFRLGRENVLRLPEVDGPADPPDDEPEK